MSKPYLVDLPEKEPEAIRRFLNLLPIAQWLFMPLKLNYPFSWCILQAREDRITKYYDSDVDILTGPLSWANPKEFESIYAEEAKDKQNWHPFNIESFNRR